MSCYFESWSPFKPFTTRKKSTINLIDCNFEIELQQSSHKQPTHTYTLTHTLSFSLSIALFPHMFNKQRHFLSFQPMNK